MKYWELIFEGYLEMLMAACMAQQECISMIDQRRYDEAMKAGQSRDGYYDCAIIAINMM